MYQFLYIFRDTTRHSTNSNQEIVSSLHVGKFAKMSFPSVREFRAPGSVRFPMLLLRILPGILSPAQGAPSQEGGHAPGGGGHSGYVIRGLVTRGGGQGRGGGGGGRGGRGTRGVARVGRRVPVEALQVRQEPQPERVPLVQALHRHQVTAHFRRALAPTHGVVIHRQLGAVVVFRTCNPKANATLDSFSFGL